MVDTVTTQTLEDGNRNLVIRMTNLSDGTGESAVKKVDVSAHLGPTGQAGLNLGLVAIKKIEYSVAGMAATLLWDATTDVQAVVLQGDGTKIFDPPLNNTKATGYTGDIMLTTLGHTAADSYDITLHMIKK